MTATLELTKNDAILIWLRDRLYFGSWERMKTDLKDRESSPSRYHYETVNRISKDLKRIDGLQDYERSTDSNITEDYDSRLQELLEE